MNQTYVFYPQRFQSAAQFYAAGRPSYPSKLILGVADLLDLQPSHRFLDLGTGPGFLAVDFAPYVAEVIGIDPSAEMLQVAQKNAESLGKKVTFIQGSSNNLGPELGLFQAVGIGRAFHWMDRAQTLASLDALVNPSGAVVLFSESHPDVPANSWSPVFREIMDKFTAADPAKSQIRPAHKHEAVLLDSKFNDLERIIVYERRATPLERFADRALSYASVWAGTPDLQPEEVARQITAGLEKFSNNGVIHEVIAGEALVARRS